MDTEILEDTLNAHGIRPTAVRLLVLKAARGFSDTFSLTDVENALDTVDRSSVFRALTAFTEHHLLHEVDDGSGMKKYCLCHNDHACLPEEMHCHFYCERCRRTYCLETTALPHVELPSGFEVSTGEYVLKGICPNCRAK